MNYATALTGGQVAGAKVNADPIAALGARRAITEFVGSEPSPEVLAALEKGADGKPPTPAVFATVLVGSPDFQKR
jgi:hypothetical protein